MATLVLVAFHHMLQDAPAFCPSFRLSYALHIPPGVFRH